MIKAEDLISFAGARGIDLVSAAQGALRTDGVARRRRATFQERLEGIPVAETAHGSQTRSMRKPGLSADDLAWALGGCPRMPYLAAWFSWGRDDFHFSEITRGLIHVALDVSGRQNWPKNIWHGEVAYHYLPALVSLVFEADRHSQFYWGNPHLFASRMGVSFEVWCARLEGRFLYLDGRYDGWLEEALHHVGRRMHEPRPKRVVDTAVAAH